MAFWEVPEGIAGRDGRHEEDLTPRTEEKIFFQKWSRDTPTDPQKYSEDDGNVLGKIQTKKFWGRDLWRPFGYHTPELVGVYPG